MRNIFFRIRKTLLISSEFLSNLAISKHKVFLMNFLCSSVSCEWAIEYVQKLAYAKHSFEAFFAQHYKHYFAFILQMLFSCFHFRLGCKRSPIECGKYAFMLRVMQLKVSLG